MKKIAFLLLGMLLITSVNAQIRWGIKAGGNISKFTTNANEQEKNYLGEYKAQFGFHVGGMMEFSFSKSFAIQPEFMFIQNGTKINHDGLQYSRPKSYSITICEIALTKENNRVVLNQLQLPIYLKYKLGTDNLKFYAMTGPYFTYSLSGKNKYDENGMTYTEINIYNDDDMLNMPYNRFDCGIGVGIGVEFKKYVLGLNHQYGLTDLSSKYDYKTKLGTFLFSVGYFF